VLPSDELPRDELLLGEKEALGLYVSSHPLRDCRRQLARAVTCAVGDLGERYDNETVTVGGIVGAAKPITTRRGEQMMFLRLDDLTGSLEAGKSADFAVLDRHLFRIPADELARTQVLATCFEGRVVHGELT
jgi:DNA polymerase III alpha subunit